MASRSAAMSRSSRSRSTALTVILLVDSESGALAATVAVSFATAASSSAAGSGYVDAATLAKIASETRSKYSSFGGIMLWDASQAYGQAQASSWSLCLF